MFIGWLTCIPAVLLPHSPCRSTTANAPANRQIPKASVVKGNCKKKRKNLVYSDLTTIKKRKRPKPTHHPRKNSNNLTTFSKIYLFDSNNQFIFDNYCQFKSNKLKTTGEIIREQRETKGLLLRQVAAKLDIDTAILSKIERSERKATRIQIANLAEILDLNKDELLIQYLSENIAYEIADDEFANQALKVAEVKVEYLKSHKTT